MRTVGILAVLFAFLGGAWAQDAPAQTDEAKKLELSAIMDMAKMYKAQTLESESLVTVKAILGKRATLEMRHRVKVTLQRPDKFRAEVTLLNVDGTDNEKYITVSDGAKVITYRPDKKEYSTQTSADFFSGGQDTFAAAGVMGALLLNKDLADGIGQVTPEIADLVVAGIRGSGAGFAVASETIEQVPRTVVTLDNAKDGFKIRFHVKESAPILAEIVGRDKTSEFTLSEKVTRFEANAAPDPSLFRWTPPAGVKKVEKIHIEIFPPDKAEKL